MHIFHSNFPLTVEGGVIVVPGNLTIHPSANAELYPDTPVFLLTLRAQGNRGSYYFKEDGERSNGFGMRLFVPKETRPGSKLVIVRRDSQTAAARFATDAEIAMATPAKPLLSSGPKKPTTPDDRRLRSRGSM